MIIFIKIKKKKSNHHFIKSLETILINYSFLYWFLYSCLEKVQLKINRVLLSSFRGWAEILTHGADLGLGPTLSRWT